MNIKKVLLLFVAAFFIVPLHAQWAVGGKLGMNASSVNYPGDTETPDYTIMANGGFFAEYTFHKNFSLQGELLYMRHGYKDEVEVWENVSDGPQYLKWNVYFHDLEIPIVAKLKHKNGFNLQAGPQLDLRLKTKTQMDDISLFPDGMGKGAPIGCSLVFGAGYEDPTGLLVDFRYILGLTEQFKHTDSFQNRAFYLSVGYRFEL